MRLRIWKFWLSTCSWERRTEPEQIVLEREVESRPARVPLSPGAAAELVVDPARFVSLGPHDIEPPKLRNPPAKLDVGTSTGHVRSDSNRAPLAGLRDDLCLPLVLLSIKDVVLYAAPLEECRDVLRYFDRNGAHQDRLALLVALNDVLYNRVVLGLFAPVD